MTSNSSTEIKIAKSKKAISLDQQCAPATIYKNSDIDPYIMVSAGEYIIKCSEIVRELVIESMPTLSEREYNSIVDDGSTVLVTANEELEYLEEQALEGPEPTPEIRSVTRGTRSGRRISKSTRYQDFIMW